MKNVSFGKDLVTVMAVFAMAFGAVSCGSNGGSVAQSGTGTVAFQVKWVVPIQNASPALSRNDPNYAASIDCAALGVASVMAAVTDSAAKVIAIGGPFACTAGSGTITGVPAGTGYTVVFQGISLNNTVAYQGLKTYISVTAGQATNAGTIVAAPVTTSVSVLGASSMGISAASIIAAINTAGTGTDTGAGTGVDTGTATACPAGTTGAYPNCAAIGSGAGTGTDTGTATACPTGSTGTYPNCVANIAAPTAPTGVTATAGSGGLIVSWSAVTGATTYNVYYKTSTGVTAANGTKVPGATSGSAITGLASGTPFYFVVTAVNAAGESAVSSEVSATTAVLSPTAPTGLAATAGNAQVTLSWTAVAGATSYNAYYKTTAGVTIANGTKVTGATSGSAVTGLANGTLFYFVVTAVNAGGESAVSNEVSATPNLPRYTNNGNGTITQNATGLMWQQQDDATGGDWATAGTYCAGLGLGGYSGWRLPTEAELKGIVDTYYNPTINPIFTNTQFANYWSSDTYDQGAGIYALVVNFSLGHSTAWTKTYKLYVRCVRLGTGAATSCPTGQTGTYPNCVVATYSLSGTVTSSGAALAGVTMTLTGASSTSTTTDASGNYTFGNLANGSYTITPTNTGYTFTPASSSVTMNGANFTAASFTAAPIACPANTTGTYPNCVAMTCPAGQTGTYPNCLTPPSAAPAYTNNGNGTITANATGLMWQQENNFVFGAWATDGAYCAGLALGGYSGWRLPTIDELKSIIDMSLRPTINTTYFTGAISYAFWTSTTNAVDNTLAWFVNFSDGGFYDNGIKASASYAVRCVRP